MPVLRPRTRAVSVLVACACILSAASPLAAAAQDTPTPRLALKPARYAGELSPGSTRTVDVVASNDTGRTLTVRFQAIQLVAGDEDSFAAPAPRPTSRSAVGWMTFDEAPHRMAPGAKLTVPVKIAVPAQARPGAYAVAVAATQTFSAIGANGADTIGSKVEVQASAGSTFVIVVPGEAKAEATILKVRAPRVVWAGDEPSFRVRVRNSGDTLLKLESATELSSFGAFASRRLRSAERPTLPEGERELTMRWSDRPWIGWFTPKLVVVGGSGSGVRIERDLETVFVIPPWWVVVLLLVALAVPLWSGHKRRQRIRILKERRADRIARRQGYEDDGYE